MSEEVEIVPTVEPSKRRGWPKGKPRKPKVVNEAAEYQAIRDQLLFTNGTGMIASARGIGAPVHVKLRLKGYPETIEFGCGRRFVENGFHVFVYPSERDRYRDTRREFAISEIVEIEITEARDRQIYDLTATAMKSSPPRILSVPEPLVTGPVIHNPRQAVMDHLASGNGPAPLSELPGSLVFGNSAG